MSRGHLFLLAILAALAIAWLAATEQSQQNERPQQTVEDDYFLEDFALNAYDHDGRLTHRLFGSTLRQRSGSHDFELEAPRFLLSSDPGQWEITARSGWMDAAMTRAQLRGQITAVATARDALTLTTSDLDLDLNTHLATTDALVNITQGDNRLRGEALTANLQTHLLRLRHNIEGYYVP